MKKIAVLGAGVTGLAVGMKLSENFKTVVLDKEKNIGGMSTSFKYKGFTLDYGPHKIYSQIPGIVEEIKEICPLIRVKKVNSIYIKGNFFDFPLKIGQIASKMPLTALSSVKDVIFKKKRQEDSYENYLLNAFGPTLYNMVFGSYAQKLWGDPKELDVELAKRRVAVSGFVELLKSVLLKKNEKISADYFYYPGKGSYELYDRVAEKIKENKGEILTNSIISEMKIDNGKILYMKVGKDKLSADFFVSTIPLPNLIKILKPAPEKEVTDAAMKLKYKDSSIIYFLIKKGRVLKENWIFFPEKNIIFNRVSEQKSFSQQTCPKDKTALMVETTRNVDKETLEIVKGQLIKLGFFQEEDIEEILVKKLEKAYPIYDKGYKKNLDIVLGYLDKISNLITIGRHGLFNYNNIDQCWDMARKLDEHLTGNKTGEEWVETRKIFDKYTIVD